MPEPSPVKGFGLLTPAQQEFLVVFSELPDKDKFYLKKTFLDWAVQIMGDLKR